MRSMLRAWARWARTLAEVGGGGMTKESSTNGLRPAAPSQSIADAIHVWNVHALVAQALTRTQLAVFAQAFHDALFRQRSTHSLKGTGTLKPRSAPDGGLAGDGELLEGLAGDGARGMSAGTPPHGAQDALSLAGYGSLTAGRGRGSHTRPSP